MAILSGKRLGPYEILSAIGAGGMGEVYRARDTRLERIVAVKIQGSRKSAATPPETPLSLPLLLLAARNPLRNPITRSVALWVCPAVAKMQVPC